MRRLHVDNPRFLVLVIPCSSRKTCLNPNDANSLLQHQLFHRECMLDAHYLMILIVIDIIN